MSKDEYLITDAPLKALTVFAMPMILGSFFQQVYNMADSIIVGQFVGSSALAAVGACAALTNVFICVALQLLHPILKCIKRLWELNLLLTGSMLITLSKLLITSRTRAIRYIP